MKFVPKRSKTTKKVAKKTGHKRARNNSSRVVERNGMQYDETHLPCVIPGCSKRGICKTEDGRVCVTHWEKQYEHDQATAPTSVKSGTVRTRKGAVQEAVVAYLDEWFEKRDPKKKPPIEKMESVVRSVKPDSKFSRSHYNWYLNKYHKDELKGQ